MGGCKGGHMAEARLTEFDHLSERHHKHFVRVENRGEPAESVPHRDEWCRARPSRGRADLTSQDPLPTLLKSADSGVT